jgi:hypothetical protein
MTGAVHATKDIGYEASPGCLRCARSFGAIDLEFNDGRYSAVVKRAFKNIVAK